MDYYVDATGGDDDNDGGSPATAWQTIAKVNAATLWPDDGVWFKRGETWSGTRLTVPASGTLGHPITFGAYGTGDAPIIESAADTASVRTNGKNFLTFQGLHVRYSTEKTFHILTSAYVTVDGCTITGDPAQRADGILVQGPAATTHDITISNCTVTGAKVLATGGAGIFVTYTGAGGPTDVTIQDCIVHDNGTSASTDHGIYLLYATNVTVTRNQLYSNTASGIKVSTSCANIIVDSNTIYSNGASGVQLTGTQAAPNNNQFINNLIYSNTSHGLFIDANVDEWVIYHNTLVNNLATAAIELASGAQGHIIKNNIFFNDYDIVGDGKEPVRCATATEVSANTWDYNDVWYADHAAEAGVSYRVASPLAKYALAAWQALAGSPEAHGISAGPVFTTEFTDLHLQVTSPCIAAGDATVGVLLDHDGVVRGAAVDCGAYEYV